MINSSKGRYIKSRNLLTDAVLVGVLRPFTHVDCHFFRHLAQSENEESSETELTKKHARFGPIFDDAASVDVSESGTFFQCGDGGGPDGTFGSGRVFEIVGAFEMDEADFCDRDFGHFCGNIARWIVNFPNGEGL